MYHILVTDDCVSITHLMTIALADDNHEVTVANDGTEGLAWASKKKFDLIISDLNMPKMNGFEMVKQIRLLPNYENVPIIILTTETSNDLVRQGKEIGVQAWAVKPFKPQVIRNIVDNFLLKSKE